VRSLYALALALTSGCVTVTDYDPVGNASAIAGSWTIDGATPTDVGCRDLMRSLVPADSEPPIPRVRVAFVDGDRPVPHSGLVFPCFDPECPTREGCVDGAFDTGQNLVVAAGDWMIRLEAIDDGGNTIAMRPEAPYTAIMDGRIELASTNFLSAVIDATIQIDGAAVTNASCERLGIVRIELVFDAAGGEVARTPPFEPCGAGAVGTRVAPGASYTVHLRALDIDGATIAETAPETFDLAAGGRAQLAGGAPIELAGP
jgi:hypothetical protein